MLPSISSFPVAWNSHWVILISWGWSPNENRMARRKPVLSKWIAGPWFPCRQWRPVVLPIRTSEYRESSTTTRRWKWTPPTYKCKDTKYAKGRNQSDHWVRLKNLFSWWKKMCVTHSRDQETSPTPRNAGSVERVFAERESSQNNTKNIEEHDQQYDAGQRHCGRPPEVRRAQNLNTFVKGFLEKIWFELGEFECSFIHILPLVPIFKPKIFLFLPIFIVSILFKYPVHIFLDAVQIWVNLNGKFSWGFGKRKTIVPSEQADKCDGGRYLNPRQHQCEANVLSAWEIDTWKNWTHVTCQPVYLLETVFHCFNEVFHFSLNHLSCGRGFCFYSLGNVFKLLLSLY